MGQHLTVYHIRSRMAKKCKKSFKSILRDSAQVQAFYLTKDIPLLEAQLFLSRPKKKSELKLPPWVAFLEPGFGELPVPTTQSMNAILFVRIPYEEAKEVFAFTFGYGRFLLKPKSYDQSYGLRTTLNVIYDKGYAGASANRLRSVAAKTIAANTVRTNWQADRKATFETFGIDIQRDLLSAVTGTVINSKDWGKRISGSDSLTATPNIAFEGLLGFCELLAKTYRDESYKQDFAWIDNLRVVTDSDLLSKLQDELIRMIRSNSPDIALTVPEMIEFSDIDHFYFSFNDKHTFHDLDEVSLIKELRDSKHDNELVLASELGKKSDKKSGIDKLEEDWSLKGVPTSANIAYDWPLLHCLSGEIEYKKKTYILSEGEFFEVDNDFLKRLNRFIRSLPDTKVPLPVCPGEIPEGDYNEYAADGSPSLLLMDKKNVSISGRTTPVEVCDLLTDDNCFVHVKRKLSSSSLSHLFAQGYISAELFFGSREYREKALTRIKIEEGLKGGVSSFIGTFSKWFSLFSPGRTTRRKYEVLYAIIAKWNGRNIVDALPFFSKVNLRRHAEDLRRMGYRVSVARIEVAKSKAKKKTPKGTQKSSQGKSKVQVAK